MPWRQAIFVLDDGVPNGERLVAEFSAIGLDAAATFRIRGGEPSKTFAVLGALLERCVETSLDRRSGVLVAIGGGAVCDLTGLAAALYLRGISYVLIPTTIIALADAAIGGKVGINLGGLKNGVGTFYAPAAVLCDPQQLRSTSAADFRTGCAELVKVALVAEDGGTLLQTIEQNATMLASGPPQSDDGLVLIAQIATAAIKTKLRHVVRDWEEQDLDRHLNLGHSLGNPLTLGGIPHGSAVAVGILSACQIGVDLGLCPESYMARIESVLSTVGCLDGLEAFAMSPTEARRRIRQVVTVRGGAIREVIPVSPGASVIRSDIDPDALAIKASRWIPALRTEATP